jgi:hypothetical protein
MSWHSFIGRTFQYAGAAGTVTLSDGEIVYMVVVYSTGGGSWTMFGGPSIPVVATAAPQNYQFDHTLFVAPWGGSNTLVFTGTNHYFVNTIRSGNV